jgi:MFS family permease
MSNVQNAFKHNRARKNVIIGGMTILVAITLLSCVSSYTIYFEGFADMPRLFQVVLSLFAVIVVEGAFVWLVYGFTRAFASFLERSISFMGMVFLVGVMLINIVTHFMMVKRLELHPFQYAWLSWGAVTIFIAVLVLVLAITLADPVIRLIRLELKYLGRQQEVILEAKHDGLESEKIRVAMATRAEQEADQLAANILGGYLPPAPQQAVRPIGFDRRGQDNHPPQQSNYNYNYHGNHEGGK